MTPTDVVPYAVRARRRGPVATPTRLGRAARAKHAAGSLDAAYGTGRAMKAMPSSVNRCRTRLECALIPGTAEA
jgi:hypothetical protein